MHQCSQYMGSVFTLVRLEKVKIILFLWGHKTPHCGLCSLSWHRGARTNISLFLLCFLYKLNLEKPQVQEAALPVPMRFCPFPLPTQPLHLGQDVLWLGTPTCRYQHWLSLSQSNGENEMGLTSLRCYTAAWATDETFSRNFTFKVIIWITKASLSLIQQH